MPTPADRNIAALRSGHESLAALVHKLSDDDLARPSGCSDWDISQVLSHLGSGSIIGKAAVDSAAEGTPIPGREFNHTVWDRWNAMSRRDRADEFLTANDQLVSRYEQMDAQVRENLLIDLGFLPAPVDVATSARMRLSEFALHSWDVRVGFDPRAEVAAEAVEPLLEDSGSLFMWIAKPGALDGVEATIEVRTTSPQTTFALRLGEQVGLEREVPSTMDGALNLPAEAWLRLVAGRLAPQHTPESVSISGEVGLALLRRVFPGY